MSEERKREVGDTTVTISVPKIRQDLLVFIIPIVAAILVVIFMVLIIPELGLNNDYGKSISSDQDTYETSKYEIGYPEDWEVVELEEFGVTFFEPQNQEELEGLLSYEISLPESVNNDEVYQNIVDGECEALGDELLGDDPTSEMIVSEIRKLHGNDACYYNVEIEFIESEDVLDVNTYMVINSENEEEKDVYVVSVTASQNIPEDLVNEALDAFVTFRFK